MLSVRLDGWICVVGGLALFEMSGVGGRNVGGRKVSHELTLSLRV